MSIQIYNTLTRTKEPLETIEPGKVRMYVCGPTVYNKAHIGHAMSALVFDIIRRYLEYRGFNVQFAMNFTDVDDKIIRRANEMGMDPFALAEGYIQDFQKNMADLNIKPASFNPRASKEIDQIIAIVQGLIDKGAAYPLEGDVYFRVRNDPNYGKLSGRNLDDMRAGVRKEADDRKEDPMDFALWKSAKPGEPAWDSPWGPGRPGWHIECSAMNYHYFGDSIDIHGGGNDLIFPHHENEIAQSELFTGKPFARYWVHNGMLQLRGEKMSKSIGNIISIDEFLSHHSADSFRYLILNSAYRNPIVFNEDVLLQAEKALDRIRFAFHPAAEGAKGASEDVKQALSQQIAATRNGFESSMDDDFNSAGALGYIFELIRVINYSRDEGATQAELQPAQDLLLELTSVLGLTLDVKSEKQQSAEADPFVQLLVDLRLELRKQKNWGLADQIRNQLSEKGVVLEDTKDGTTWRWDRKN
ncbi:cysteine--tRNA ligase [Flexilinea flocculi]|uniref:Cysteine--tRNA ligase n=1 Tax=Flexilinea flocculi TaxID=1678840 RepID=A0A0S7BVM2_9CHLR|nr:cysteine--tRNA ligase [Flexilinea flocculi]GAP41806.1 cysteinyl-tRNA synthetase [Flexilinea flocculi]